MKVEISPKKEIVLKPDNTKDAFDIGQFSAYMPECGYTYSEDSLSLVSFSLEGLNWTLRKLTYAVINNALEDKK